MLSLALALVVMASAFTIDHEKLSGYYSSDVVAYIRTNEAAMSKEQMYEVLLTYGDKIVSLEKVLSRYGQKCNGHQLKLLIQHFETSLSSDIPKLIRHFESKFTSDDMYDLIVGSHMNYTTFEFENLPRFSWSGVCL